MQDGTLKTDTVIPNKIIMRIGGMHAGAMAEYDGTYYHCYDDIPGFAGAIGNSEEDMGSLYSLVLYRDQAELERDWEQHHARARLARLHGYTPDSEEELPAETFVLSDKERSTLGGETCLLCTRRIGLTTCIEQLTDEDDETRSRVRQFFATLDKDDRS